MSSIKDTQVYKDGVGGGLNRIANSQEIAGEKSQFRKPPQIIEVSWQTYRIVGFIFFGLSFFVMKYLVDYFEKKLNDPEILSILRIVSFFFILNFGTFLFITVYYKYRKSIKGAKGPKGSRGKRGPQGKSTNCNICNIKTGGFKKEIKRPKLKEKIDTSEPIHRIDGNEMYTWEQYDETPNLAIDYLGIGKNNDSSNNQAESASGSGSGSGSGLENKPIIGASGSFDEKTGELYNIMFYFDGNEKHNQVKYKYRIASNSNDEPIIYGRRKKQGMVADFRAPANSAIYKIDVVHNYSYIIAVRFYCADVITGKTVKVKDPLSGTLKEYGVIGKAVNNKDRTKVIDTFTASNFYYTDGDKNKDYFQSFISKISCKGDDTSVFSLGIFQTSVYLPKKYKFKI